MQTTLQDVLDFLTHQASLKDLEAIHNASIRRARRLQEDAVATFHLHEKVLFVKDGVELPAEIVRINRHTLTLCLGEHRPHVRCDASFLRKLPAVAAE